MTAGTLLENGAEINARNLQLETPLLLAIKNGRSGIVDLLIKKKADVNAAGKDRTAPLHIASEKGNLSYINKLYSTGKLDLNIRNRDNATALQLASENQHIEVVKRLVELGAELNTKRNDGWSPLYTAAYNGDYNTAVFLLSKGADLDGRNEVSKVVLVDQLQLKNQ